MADDADVIVVGAGLAGLVAATELADAGKRIIVLDQEGEQNLGGQAFWSFGGLFLVDSPEQRRLGVKDSAELALADWLRAAHFAPDGARRGRPTSPTTGPTGGAAPGPRGSSTSPPATCGRGCTPRACAGSPSCSGRSA